MKAPQKPSYLMLEQPAKIIRTMKYIVGKGWIYYYRRPKIRVYEGNKDDLAQMRERNFNIRVTRRMFPVGQSVLAQLPRRNTFSPM